MVLKFLVPGESWGKADSFQVHRFAWIVLEVSPGHGWAKMLPPVCYEDPSLALL